VYKKRAPLQKLSPTQIEKIRAMRNSGIPQTAIGRQFGISQTHISNIMQGKRWGHSKAGIIGKTIYDADRRVRCNPEFYTANERRSREAKERR
jgi:DNA invertase Pin-like site-specific DNA recombinase